MSTNRKGSASDAKKRILYLITKASWGGAQRYVYDIAVGAAEAGHEVLVVSGAEGPLLAALRAKNIAVQPLPSLARDIDIRAEIHAFGNILSIVREFKPDVIHGNSSKAGAFAVLAGRFLRVPNIIFTAHAWAFNEQRPWWQKGILRGIHGTIVLLSHTTICVSEALARDMDWLPFGTKKIHVIHNGIVPVELLDKDAARARLAPTEQAPLWIGVIAELHPTKQLSVLIDAFAVVRARFPHIALVLIGEGETRNLLSAHIEQQEYGTCMHLCGHHENAATLLSALDVFVLPSRSEGLGYVILEAGAAGLPVIASNVGGIPEIIQHPENGLLIPSGDSAALAEQLTLLIENEPLRLSLGGALRERVLRVFSLERMVRSTLATYAN